jgi:hypothetical protein
VSREKISQPTVVLPTPAGPYSQSTLVVVIGPLHLFLATVRPSQGGKSSVFAAKNVQSRRPVCIKGASAVRYIWGFGFCLVLGLAFVTAAVTFGVLAVGQGAEVSAYHNARVCLAGASANAECLQTVTGSVTGVTEIGGKNADYALDVQTDAQNLHIRFTSDSPLLGYAVNGDPASVTMWRGIPVSVVTDSRSEATATVPQTAFAKDLGQCAELGGAGIFMVLGAAAIRRNRRVGQQPITRPVVVAVLLALGLGAFVVLVGGFALGGKPSRLGPDAAATGAALVVVFALSAWLGITVRRRNHRDPGAFPASAPVAPIAAARRTPRPAMPLRVRLHPAAVGPVLLRRAAIWTPVLLTVAVLFGVFLTTMDGPPARAYRHAPACAGETDLATCVGDFTATVNGVRTDSQSNDNNYANVSYVTGDGVINTWATFDGNGSDLARAAEADENQRTPLTIKIWRGSIVGADLGGTWHWAENNPPGDAVPSVFLGVSFALLLLWVRVRIHRRSGSLPQADRRWLLVEDVTQPVAAACATLLLAYGFWPGAIVALASLAWLALSVRRSTSARKQALLTSLS